MNKKTQKRKTAKRFRPFTHLFKFDSLSSETVRPKDIKKTILSELNVQEFCTCRTCRKEGEENQYLIMTSFFDKRTNQNVLIFTENQKILGEKSD